MGDLTWEGDNQPAESVACNEGARRQTCKWSTTPCHEAKCRRKTLSHAVDELARRRSTSERCY
eukprot:4918018-Amphidinium_carterae.2